MSNENVARMISGMDSGEHFKLSEKESALKISRMNRKRIEY